MYRSHILIGTVQSQYTRGPLSIATWAHLTNAHLFPGPSIISALHSAASATLTSLNQSVFTEITTGTPRASLDGSSSGGEAAVEGDDHDNDDSDNSGSPQDPPRKNSVVTATTTISQTFEPNPPSLWNRSLSVGDSNTGDREKALQELGPPPHARGLLLIAEMSSEGNLITPAYTSSCVSAARAQPDFVMGFISQHALNSGPRDVFLNFTPGVSLPPEGEDGIRKGDGFGQRWRSPRDVVVGDGADVIIVGRGVLGAKDRRAEADRYRKKGWEAYEERIGRRNECEDDD